MTQNVPDARPILRSRSHSSDTVYKTQLIKETTVKDLARTQQDGWIPLPRVGRSETATDPGRARPLPDAKFAYTISEVGELLGFCRATIYKLIAAGELRTVNLSDRAPRVLRDELLGFLDRKAAEAAAVEEGVRRKFGLRAGVR